MRITRAIDNRPMSFRSQALFRSHHGEETCLAAALPAIQPSLPTQLHPYFRTLNGPGKSRLRGSREQRFGWNGNTNTGNFSNSMTICSPTSACRARMLKMCGGRLGILWRGATANDIPTFASVNTWGGGQRFSLSATAMRSRTQSRCPSVCIGERRGRDGPQASRIRCEMLATSVSRAAPPRSWRRQSSSYPSSHRMRALLRRRRPLSPRSAPAA